MSAPADPLADLARLEGVPSAVAAALAAVDAVLRDRGPRRITAGQQAQAQLAAGQASAALTAEPQRWAAGALRLAREQGALVPLIVTTPAQALARAHAVAARGVLPDEQLGRLVDDASARDRLRALTELLRTPTAASALVLAAVAHAEIAVVAPFGPGSDLVARTVERLLLSATGVDPAGVILTEAGHQGREAAYRAGLAGYATGSATGVRAWLLHCAAAVADGAEQSPLARRIAP